MRIIYQFRDGSVITDRHPYTNQILEILKFIRDDHRNWKTKFIDVDDFIDRIIRGGYN